MIPPVIYNVLPLYIGKGGDTIYPGIANGKYPARPYGETIPYTFTGL